MRTCTRRTGGLGDVGVAGQTPASTIHAEERTRHALARTVTQYAARSWLPVASTIRACTHGNRSAGGTGAPCGQHNPCACAHSNLRANSATSSAFKHNPRACTHGNVGLRRFRHHGCSTIHALAHTATAPVPPIRCLVAAQSARMRAQQRGQLVDSASGDAVRPEHLHARQQPTMLPQALSRHASDGTRHSSPATPTRLVHEDALCFLARLEKRIFSLGAGDKHGRDSQAD